MIMKVMTIEEILIRVKNAMKIGEYNLAGDLLNKIISTKQDFFLPYMLLGNVYERTGKIDKALQSYKQSIRLKPDNVEAYNNLGITYKRIKKYKEALAFLKRALLLDPHRADIHYNLGNVYKETGNLEQAIKQYEKSIETDPLFVPAYNNLGIVLETLEKFDVAGQVYSLGLEVDINNPKLHYNLGNIYEKQNKLKQARLEFERALKTKPGWSDALLNLGIVLSKLEEHNKSINTYQSILKIDPVNVKAINNLGIEHSKLKNIEKAKDFYHKAINLDPDYTKAHFNLGTLLEDQGEYKQALLEIENLLKKNPDNIPARFRLGNIYTALGKYRKAEIQFRSILKHNPEHGETLRAMGNLYLRTGKYDEANKCFKQLSRMHPDMEDYHLDFAVLLNDKKEFEKSEAEVKKFLSANPEDINAQSLLGELYFKQDLLKNASDLFEQIIEKNPHVVKPYYYLAKTYKKLGNSEKAIETIDKLITIQGTRGTHADIENLNKTIELYEKAAKEYEHRFKVKLHKDIAHLDDFSYDPGEDTGSGEDPDLLYSLQHSLKHDLNVQGTVDDADSIIKTGGIEPVIPVKEEVEQIKIVETIQEESPPMVEIEDSEPLPFTDLLKNQELYETLPALASKLLEQKKEQESLAGKNEKDKAEQLKKKDIQDLAEQLKEINKQNSTDQLKEQKIQPVIKQMEKEEVIKEFLNKGSKGEESDILYSLADKIDSLAEKAKKEKGFMFKPGDKADETLLDVLKDISGVFKEGIKPGFSPGYYFPVRRKRHPHRKEKQTSRKQESLDEYLKKKAKTTREKLKEFFGNVRKKLDEKPDIEIPDDKKKQENIQNLVEKISKSNPFKENITHPVKENQNNKKNGEKENRIKRTKQDYGRNITEVQEEKSEPIRIEVSDEDLVSGKKYNLNKSKKECKETGGQTDIDNKLDEQTVLQETMKTGNEPQEKKQEKSFKPIIRPEKKNFPRTIIIKTLRFFRKLLGFVLKTGTKSRFDDYIKKMEKE
ncbi:MAG: tetratricopeptide repeat protein [Spirochaetales bacterium]|nr:tetratricopeptide repeat protein [Spirochaetales bacterium]